MTREEMMEQLISLRENAKANIDTDEIFRKDYEALNEVLTLIAEQENEIKLSNKVTDKRNTENLKLATINLNKSKIIKEMSIFMANSDIDEEICKNQVATFCADKPEGVTLDVCAKCIEQYFKKKVENDN